MERYRMIQQFHFWLYNQKNWKQGPEETFVHHVQSSIIHDGWDVAATHICW